MTHNFLCVQESIVTSAKPDSSTWTLPIQLAASHVTVIRGGPSVRCVTEWLDNVAVSRTLAEDSVTSARTAGTAVEVPAFAADVMQWGLS